MFLCGHHGVTEALGNGNPLPFSHSKDCPIFAWRGWGPSSGAGDPPQRLHMAVAACPIPPPPPQHGHVGSWGAGTLASAWLLAGCWIPATCQHTSMIPLPTAACCMPGLLPPLESLLPAPCPPFPTLQPRGLPGQCCQSWHCMPGSLAGGLCAPTCPAVACGQHHCRQGNGVAGSCLPCWGCHCGRVLAGSPPRNLGAESKTVPFDPCHLAACSGSSAGRGFPPLPHSHCIPKPRGSTPGSSTHYLQLPSLS